MRREDFRIKFTNGWHWSVLVSLLFFSKSSAARSHKMKEYTVENFSLLLACPFFGWWAGTKNFADSSSFIITSLYPRPAFLSYSPTTRFGNYYKRATSFARFIITICGNFSNCGLSFRQQFVADGDDDGDTDIQYPYLFFWYEYCYLLPRRYNSILAFSLLTPIYLYTVIIVSLLVHYTKNANDAMRAFALSHASLLLSPRRRGI